MVIPDLFHVSENPNIKKFIPLPASNKDAGVEGDAVWAITNYELANYILPRDCPRICYRNQYEQKIISIEEAWVERVNAAKLYIYTFDSFSFKEVDPIAGYWISRKTVKPKLVSEVSKILQKLSELNVKLKILPHLCGEKEYVLSKYTNFSIIRFRNAQKI